MVSKLTLPVIARNVRQVMPSRREERLIFLGQQASDISWEIGRETLAQIKECELVGAEITEDQVKSYVAELTGKSFRTIRFYVEICRFYPPEVQEHFDVFTFDHFVIAKRVYNDLEKAVQLLEVGQRRMDEAGGRRPSADWLEQYATVGSRQAYEQELDRQPAQPPEDMGQMEDDREAVNEMIGEVEPLDPGEQPDAIRQAACYMVQHMEREYEFLQAHAPRLPVRVETAKQLQQVLNGLASVILDIKDELKMR